MRFTADGGVAPAWADLQHPDEGKVRFDHGHYLKIWSLTNPKIAADFLLLDEAQDINPVVEQILNNQRSHAQLVMVGDSAQAIYQWRGAKDVMTGFDGTALALSKSFRFGPLLAHEANRWLAIADAPIRLQGSEAIPTELGLVPCPDAVLCCTNDQHPAGNPPANPPLLLTLADPGRRAHLSVVPDTVSADNGRGGPVVRKLDPEIARKRMISYGMEPTVPYPGCVDAPWPGICLACKQPASPTLSNAKRQGVCAPCGQDLAAEALRLPLSEVVRALEGRGAIVIGDYKNNREGIECICLRCGALIYPAYSNAMRKGVGLCDKQCKRDRIGDSNRADAEEAAEFARANDLIPLAPYTGADDPWPLECARCGHVGSKTTYSVIKQLGHVCTACGRVRTANARRLQSASALQSMLDAKLKPDVPYPGRVNDPWPCTCMVCKVKIRPGPRLNDIRNGGQGGCTTCSDTSFKQGEPAHIYLVVNYEIRFLKWGKANDVVNRLREHARQGFGHEVGRWSFALGAEATLVERAIKAEVRALGATTQADKGLMRYKGYTETASMDEVTVTEVLAIIQRLVSASPDLPIPADVLVSVPHPRLIGTPRAQQSSGSSDGPSVTNSVR